MLLTGNCNIENIKYMLDVAMEHHSKKEVKKLNKALEKAKRGVK